MKRIQASEGFTLIELMVTISIVAILLVIAIPSFNEFRQRAALRGAADQIATFWGDARFEALRRNQFVKVGFVTSGANYCIGAATTTSSADDTPCDCKTAGACNISTFPTNAVTTEFAAKQTEWRSILVATATTMGDDDGGVIVIDPKRGNITEAADVGRISLKTPESTNANYRLDIVFDRNGRAVICEPTAAPNKLPQFTNRRC